MNDFIVLSARLSTFHKKITIFSKNVSGCTYIICFYLLLIIIKKRRFVSIIEKIFLKLINYLKIWQAIDQIILI